MAAFGFWWAYVSGMFRLAAEAMSEGDDKHVWNIPNRTLEFSCFHSETYPLQKKTYPQLRKYLIFTISSKTYPHSFETYPHILATLLIFHSKTCPFSFETCPDTGHFKTGNAFLEFSNPMFFCRAKHTWNIPRNIPGASQTAQRHMCRPAGGDSHA